MMYRKLFLTEMVTHAMMMIIFVWILVEFKNLDFFNFKFEVPTASVCKGKYDLSVLNTQFC